MFTMSLSFWPLTMVSGLPIAVAAAGAVAAAASLVGIAGDRTASSRFHISRPPRASGLTGDPECDPGTVSGFGQYSDRPESCLSFISLRVSASKEHVKIERSPHAPLSRP